MGLEHEKMTAEKEIKLIASLGAKRKVEGVEMLDYYGGEGGDGVEMMAKSNRR